MTHQKEQPMNSEKELFKQAYMNLRSGDRIPFPDDIFDEFLKLRQGYELVPENEINIMDMIHGKCPCGSSRLPIISDKEGYSLIHCFSCGANKYIHEDY